MGNRIILFLLLLLLLSDLNIYPGSQDIIPGNERGAPFISNFTPNEYGMDWHWQNLAVCQDHRGVMYFGNNQALLEFDGENWRDIPIPDRSIVRSLAVDNNGTVFVGADGDLGFLAIDESGEKKYVSLKSSLPAENKKFGPVWRTHATREGIYFKTMDHIFHYKNGAFTVISALNSRFSSCVYDRVFYYADGLVMIENDQPVRLTTGQEWVGDYAGLVLLLPYPQDQLLLITSGKGFYIYNFNDLLKNKESNGAIPANISRRITTDCDDYFRNHALYCCAVINAHTYALGTMGGGVVLLDEKGKLIQIINQHRGLYNDQVTDLHVDSEQNLWATLIRGIALIQLNSPFSQFDRLSGIEEGVEPIIRHQGVLYVGTWNGVKYLPPYQLQLKDDKYSFLPVPEIKSKCWCFIQVKSRLFAGGNFGVKEILNKKVSKSTLYPNRDLVICFGQSPRFPGYVFMGLLDGLKAFSLPAESSGKPAGFAQLNMIDKKYFPGIRGLIKKIIADKKGNLWITSEIDGIYYLRFKNSSPWEYDLMNYSTAHGLPSNNRNFVHIINNRLLIGSKHGLYRAEVPESFDFDPREVRFVPDACLGKKLIDPKLEIWKIEALRDKNIWVSTSAGLCQLRTAKNKVVVNDFTSFIPAQGIDNFEVEESGYIWLGLGEVLLRYDCSVAKDYSRAPSVLIRKVTLKDGQEYFNGSYYDPASKSGNYFLRHSQSQSEHFIPRFSYSNNSLIFEYAAPSYEHQEAIGYQYQLAGFDQGWSKWSMESKKEYTNLYEGNYCFRVRSKNIWRVKGQDATYSFLILPPWQRTTQAYVGYGLLLICFLYIAYRFNSRRVGLAKMRLEKIIQEKTRQLIVQNEEIEKKNIELKKAYNQVNVSNRKLEEFNLELEKLASVDGLTLIANKRVFKDFINRQWKNSLRKQLPISLIFLDVDFFKQYNDTYGHHSGDECLVKLARVLDQTVQRPIDLVARYGGEEFVVVLSETDLQGAVVVAEKIREQVVDLKIEHHTSTISPYITVSLGVASIIPSQNDEVGMLVKLADAALYKSKNSGRNCVS